MMKRIFVIILFCKCCFVLCLPTVFAKAVASQKWEKSLVDIEISQKRYDYFQPWAPRNEIIEKQGVVVNGNFILTTAQYFNNSINIRIRKGGVGKWWDAEVKTIDYHANLALIRPKAQQFFDGLVPISISEKLPVNGQIDIIRWRENLIELRKAEITRPVIKPSVTSWLAYLHLEANCDIEGAGWSEISVLDSRLCGLVESQDGTTLTIITASMIKHFLKGATSANYRGLGYFDFVWMKGQNPDSLAWLGQTNPAKGVIVIDFAGRQRTNSLIQRGDVIVKIDGFEIDSEGYYKDPRYGRLLLEHLATFNKWAGDSIKIELIRNGSVTNVNYVIPKANFTDELVPFAVYDKEAEYYIAGGLIFQPLIIPFLKSWGSDWERKAPFRLAYYTRQKPTDDYQSRVFLFMVLPDRYNIGYQDCRFMVVDKINGVKVQNLKDVKHAFENPTDTVHIIEFAKGEQVQRIVLDASEFQSATRRILQNYGILYQYVISN